MKTSILCGAAAIAIGISLFVVQPVFSQHDCPGNFQQIPNYHPSMGHPCQYLGLNSRQGTCRPGDVYETLCDDASGGRYKICQGPRLCNAQVERAGDCRQWDFVNNQPCPPGYVNVDCQGYCEPAAFPGR